ncbi:MAG: hypothetical protein JWQ73_1029 [Variovorax sp.]|nr:hypothetical protein [Variovorax sp.]
MLGAHDARSALRRAPYTNQFNALLCAMHFIEWWELKR